MPVTDPDAPRAPDRARPGAREPRGAAARGRGRALWRRSRAYGARRHVLPPIRGYKTAHATVERGRRRAVLRPRIGPRRWLQPEQGEPTAEQVLARPRRLLRELPTPRSSALVADERLVQYAARGSGSGVNAIRMTREIRSEVAFLRSRRATRDGSASATCARVSAKNVRAPGPSLAEVLMRSGEDEYRAGTGAAARRVPGTTSASPARPTCRPSRSSCFSSGTTARYDRPDRGPRQGRGPPHGDDRARANAPRRRWSVEATAAI